MPSFTYDVTAATSGGEVRVQVTQTTPHCLVELNLTPNKLALSFTDFEKITALLRRAFDAVAAYKIANGG